MQTTTVEREAGRDCRVRELAVMIQDEECCSIDEALRLADKHLEEIEALEAEAETRNVYQAAREPGPFSVSQTSHGVIARKGELWMHFDVRQLEVLLDCGRRALRRQRQVRKVTRGRLITRSLV